MAAPQLARGQVDGAPFGQHLLDGAPVPSVRGSGLLNGAPVRKEPRSVRQLDLGKFSCVEDKAGF